MYVLECVLSVCARVCIGKEQMLAGSRTGVVLADGGERVEYCSVC